MKLSTIESPDVYPTREFGFSQAVIFNRVIYGSGQVGWNKGFTLPQLPDFDHQLERALQNFGRILSYSEGDWHDVIHFRFYVVNLDAPEHKKISHFLKQTYPSGYAPGTTPLGVTALAKEDLFIEIEFTAKIKQ